MPKRKLSSEMGLLNTLQMIGDNVTLVVRLRQAGGSDAMLGSCKARGGGGNSGSSSSSRNEVSPKQGLFLTFCPHFSRPREQSMFLTPTL